MKTFGRLLRILLAFRQEKKWPFLWRAWLQATILAFLVGNVAQHLAPAGPRSDLEGMPMLSFLTLVLLVGPLIETLIFQCFSLEVTGSLEVRRSLRLAFSIALFAFIHGFAGLPTVVAAGMVGGCYFAFTYERWRRESLFVAIVMTFLLHSSFNLVGAMGMLFFSK